jgi:hypothetical protein
MMKERGILFSGPMVRAILEGRKTQTRRVVKPQPPPDAKRFSESRGVWRETLAAPGARWRCPYGIPGDRLWARETWRVSSESNHTPDGLSGTKKIYIAYKAGAFAGVARQHREDFRTPEDDDLASRAWGKSRVDAWRPSIHMPRWASRITLEITGVRVERVQEISGSDAVAEGIPAVAGTTWESRPDNLNAWVVSQFRRLWNSINAKRGYGWDANPWVWVIEFKRLEGKDV